MSVDIDLALSLSLDEANALAKTVGIAARRDEKIKPLHRLLQTLMLDYPEVDVHVDLSASELQKLLDIVAEAISRTWTKSKVAESKGARNVGAHDHKQLVSINSKLLDLDYQLNGEPF